MTRTPVKISQHRKALHSSLSSIWYSPPLILERVRTVFSGVIDLDPASDPLGNQLVRARKIFTRREDGLKQTWFGNVFMNPPYSSDGGAKVWIQKALEQQQYCRAQIWLVNATTDRTWFRPLWSGTLCFLYARLRFWETVLQYTIRAGHPYYEGPNLPPDTLIEGPQPTHGNVLAYFGPEAKRFAETFLDLGQIVTSGVAVRG